MFSSVYIIESRIRKQVDKVRRTLEEASVPSDKKEELSRSHEVYLWQREEQAREHAALMYFLLKFDFHERLLNFQQWLQKQEKGYQEKVLRYLLQKYSVDGFPNSDVSLNQEIARQDSSGILGPLDQVVTTLDANVDLIKRAIFDVLQETATALKERRPVVTEGHSSPSPDYRR